MHLPIILLTSSTIRVVQGLRPPPSPGHGDRHCLYQYITRDTYCSQGDNGLFCDYGTDSPCDVPDFPTKTTDTWSTWQITRIAVNAMIPAMAADSFSVAIAARYYPLPVYIQGILG